MMRPRPPAARRRRQRGVTLTELMIGITVGLIVTAGTLGLFAGQMRSNRDLLTSARLNTEVRASMDTMVRDLRRASYWGASQNSTWFPTNLTLQSNPFSEVDAGDGEITYRYDANNDGELDDGEVFRLERNADDGTVELHTLSEAGAVTNTVAITDPDVTEVTELDFAVRDRTGTTTCLNAGAGPVAPTPPLIHVRQVTVTITARLRAEPAVTRTMTETVRLRNDWVDGSCPT
jgi:type IV pilus assembly protein PilW